MYPFLTLNNIFDYATFALNFAALESPPRTLLIPIFRQSKISILKIGFLVLTVILGMAECRLNRFWKINLPNRRRKAYMEYFPNSNAAVVLPVVENLGSEFCMNNGIILRSIFEKIN